MRKTVAVTAVVRPPNSVLKPSDEAYMGNFILMNSDTAHSKVKYFDWFHRRRGYGVIFLRLLIGSFIIWGVQDNILSHEKMLEFEKFLAARGTPAPAFAARLSVYAQFLCGLSILLGAFVRPLAIVFIINFICAIVIAHLGQTFQQMFPALMMIASGLFFLFHGAGPFSVDDLLERRRTVPTA